MMMVLKWGERSSEKSKDISTFSKECSSIESKNFKY
jgi:hypothetical protein